MPTHKIKAQKMNETEMPMDEEYKESVYLPVSKETIEMLEVGQEVEITIKGTVKGLESREGPDSENNEIRFEIDEVSTPDSNKITDFNESLDEDD